MKAVREWLRRPQQTNRQALVVGVVGGLITSIVVFALGKLLDLAKIIDFGGSVPVWLAGVLAGTGLVLGLLARAPAATRADQLQTRVGELDSQTTQLQTLSDEYATYAEHLRDGLGDLRKILAGEFGASWQDFIETGLFQPAHRLLSRSGSRGDVRFSILHVEGEDFIMCDGNGPFPALGHTLEGRQRFKMPITESFSVFAFQRGRVYASGNLSKDERFTPHPSATRPYESIVSVPLWRFGEVDGVLNVIATSEDAFSPTDRTYISLLGSVVDVARAAAEIVDELGEAINKLPRTPQARGSDLPPGPQAN